MRKSITFLLLICLTKFASSQDDSQSKPPLLIDLALPLEDGRTLLKQLNELEFRRAEVATLLKEIEQSRAENASLAGEIRKQIDLEKESHALTKRDLALATQRAAFYQGIYEDLLKKPPKTPWLSKGQKVAIVIGAIAAAAATAYLATR